MNSQREIDKAFIILPLFESYFMDRVQVPIIEPSMGHFQDVYIPSYEAYKIKALTFVKNFVTMKWEFESKNFD
jgi:hypothetical protein